MPLEPKFQRHLGGPSLPRPFVDREELIDAFWQALARQDVSKPKVLVYYGLGGIGKSRLRRELKERLREADPQPAWAEVDFGLPSLRDPETALFSIRRELQRPAQAALPHLRSGLRLSLEALPPQRRPL